jgi:hypothetical protein
MSSYWPIIIIIIMTISCSRGSRGSLLFITNAFANDTGSYTCRAANVLGSAVSAASTVAIAVPS